MKRGSEMVGIEVYTNKKTNSENVTCNRITGLAQSISSSELVLPSSLTATANSRPPKNGALVSASLTSAVSNSAVGRKGRHLTGTFCLTGDTMEGIIQCLVFLKAFSVSSDCCWCVEVLDLWKKFKFMDEVEDYPKIQLKLNRPESFFDNLLFSIPNQSSR